MVNCLAFAKIEPQCGGIGNETTLNRTMLKKAFCITATLSTLAALLLPIAPKIAQAAGCYMLTADGRWFDMGNLCQNQVPAQVPPVQATNNNQIPTFNHRNQWGLGLDLQSYCQAKHGPAVTLVLLEDNAMGWRCLVDDQTIEISFTEACNLQYGTGAVPAVADFQNVRSLHCRLIENVPHYTSGS